MQPTYYRMLALHRSSSFRCLDCELVENCISNVYTLFIVISSKSNQRQLANKMTNKSKMLKLAKINVPFSVRKESESLTN